MMAAKHERQWVAAYTRPRHESVVAEQLQQKELAILLPTYVKNARWSDRTKRLKAPLFPSYVFVQASHEEQVRVLQTNGVVNLVSYGGKPCSLSEAEVELLRECAEHPERFEPHSFFHEGQRVRVVQGPFAGWEGVLTYKRNSTRLVISVEHLLRSVSLDLAGADVEAVN